MDKVVNELSTAEIRNQMGEDTSNQPWYIRFGVSILGFIAGVVLILSNLAGAITIHIYAIIGVIFGVILIVFESTMRW